MREAGQTVSAIAVELGRTERIVRKWLERFEEEGEEGMNPRPKPGRPRHTTQEQDRAMLEVRAVRVTRRVQMSVLVCAVV